jgi:diaminobutyrate-2-oxoglutarate transaminase
MSQGAAGDWQDDFAAPIFDRPSVRTSLPGPASAELLERQERHESSVRTYPRRLCIAIRRGSGSYVQDLDGNVFIDFLNGAGVLPLGHSHPEVTDAIQRQLPLLTHGLDFPTEAKDEFVATQLAMLPAEMRNNTKIEFCGPSGADAVDAAIKLCKTATGRSDIVSFQGGFHGCSHAAMAVSGLTAHRERIANIPAGVHFFPYPYALRCSLGGDRDSVGQRCLDYLERSLRDPLGGVPLPAAVIVEIVQGEGGVIPAPTDFVQGLRRVTHELDIPLIVDEVQSGCGRTGTWFAFEQHGIIPDVIVASKAIGGGGMPIAVIMHHERLDAFAPGAHTGTFRGNQLAFVAGVRSAQIIVRDGILDHAREMGARALSGLDALVDEHDIAREARGRGLMLGLELVDPSTGEPNSRAAFAVQRTALEHGLIVELGGRGDGVVRMLPPLNVLPETIDQALDILGVALGAAARC